MMREREKNFGVFEKAADQKTSRSGRDTGRVQYAEIDHVIRVIGHTQKRTTDNGGAQVKANRENTFSVLAGNNKNQGFGHLPRECMVRGTSVFF